uniref:Uncharacterized protein n=1 Tax=Rhipicephalus zambeziensis TaxID=60191 RepID=A0A224YAM3_9ACAR
MQFCRIYRNQPRLASTTGRNSPHLSRHPQQPTIASVYINQNTTNILREIKQVFVVYLQFRKSYNNNSLRMRNTCCQCTEIRTLLPSTLVQNNNYIVCIYCLTIQLSRIPCHYQRN